MLRQRKGEADGEGAEGNEAIVRQDWPNGGVEDEEGDMIGTFGGVLAHVGDGVTHMIKEPDPGEVRTMEEVTFDRGDDGLSFGVGNGVVDTKMVGQTGSEVGDCEDGLMGAELAEEEIERHCFVGDSGVEGWGDKSLEMDGGRAMADVDRHIQRGAVGAILGGGWGGHGGVGLSFGGKGHEKSKTVKTENRNKRCLCVGVKKVTRMNELRSALANR